MSLSGQRFEITAGPWRAEVSANGAALAGLWRAAEAVTVPQPIDQLPLKGNGQVLVPWPNRIRDGQYTFDEVEYQLALTEPLRHNASHGLARWSRFKVTAHTADSLTLAVDIVPQPGWPFELGFTLQYRLDGDSGLSVHCAAMNRGASALPFGAGFHPYVDLGATALDEAEVIVPALTRIVTDDQLVPTGVESVVGTDYDLTAPRPLGSLRLDDCFTDLASDRVAVNTGKRTASLWWDQAFTFVQVFTPDVLAPGRSGIAVEPMSCPADAFNSGNGLVRLEPGEDWHGTWGITCS